MWGNDSQICPMVLLDWLQRVLQERYLACSYKLVLLSFSTNWHLIWDYWVFPGCRDGERNKKVRFSGNVYGVPQELNQNLFGLHNLNLPACYCSWNTTVSQILSSPKKLLGTGSALCSSLRAVTTTKSSLVLMLWCKQKQSKTSLNTHFSLQQVWFGCVCAALQINSVCSTEPSG